MAPPYQDWISGGGLRDRYLPRSLRNGWKGNGCERLMVRDYRKKQQACYLLASLIKSNSPLRAC
jgi:hypothetical protein